MSATIGFLIGCLFGAGMTYMALYRFGALRSTPNFKPKGRVQRLQSYNNYGLSKSEQTIRRKRGS